MSILIAPLEALTDAELTDTERRVLLALFSFRGKATENVWPSTIMIAERANISDVPRISKITNSLAEKGWLTKKKKGFTGCNEYTLIFPDRLHSDKSGDEEIANLVNSAKLEDNASTNLAKSTKSNLAKSTKCKEQTIEQTIEQTNKPSTNKREALDYSSWPEMPNEQILIDWIASRKRKKADVSKTVLETFGKQLHMARNFGWTVNECLSECMNRGWTGFKAEWMNNANKSHGGSYAAKPTGNNNDTAWADPLFKGGSGSDRPTSKPDIQPAQGDLPGLAGSDKHDGAGSRGETPMD